MKIASMGYIMFMFIKERVISERFDTREQKHMSITIRKRKYDTYVCCINMFKIKIYISPERKWLDHIISFEVPVL